MSRPPLSQFGIQTPQNNFQPFHTPTQQQTLEKLRLKASESPQQFSSGQRRVFNVQFISVLPGVSTDSLDDAPTYTNFQSQRLCFLDAPRRTGKTFVTPAIQRFLQSRDRSVLAVGSTAVAAQLLDGGCTTHSTLETPIPVTFESTCNIEADSQSGQNICGGHLIVRDEVVINHRHSLKAIDRTLRDMRKFTLPFGGVIVLCIGDFRQILPVVRAANTSQIVNACFEHSKLYLY